MVATSEAVAVSTAIGIWKEGLLETLEKDISDFATTTFKLCVAELNGSNVVVSWILASTTIKV